MVAIKNILLFVSAVSAAALLKRDTSTILSDISTIDADLKSLTSAVNGYNGGIFGAIPVSNAESKLEDAIKSATSDAQATSQLSSDDSSSVISAANGLIPDIESALSALESKKSQFASAGLTSTVSTDLKNLKSETDAFADALIAIASDDSKTDANGVKSKIDSDFTAAQAQFQ